MVNPIIESIKSGKAPRQIQLAAAKGLLPLVPEELLEVLSILTVTQQDEETISCVHQTLNSFTTNFLLPIAQNTSTDPTILSFLCTSPIQHEVLTAAVINQATPDDTILKIANTSTDTTTLDVLIINQQRLIHNPQILDAILNNSHCSAETKRRAKEIRTEFFEKELGVKQISQEQKARIEKFTEILDIPISEEEFETSLAAFESELGHLFQDEIPSSEDALVIFNKLISEITDQNIDNTESKRLSIYEKLSQLSLKERVFVALKGNQDIRSILVRDPNRLVAIGVIKNPRITEIEVESISNMRGISEDVIRLIAMNRAWTSSYGIMHNLVRNPRCPINFCLQFINRLQRRDLQMLSKDKGVPDAVRQAAMHLQTKRQF